MKNKSSLKKIKKIFYTLLIIFILIVCYFVISDFIDVKRPFFLILAALALAFLVLGGVLIYYTLKLKVKGKLKIFLLLTGGSATGFLVCVILHNLVYALFILLFGADFWTKISIPDEPLFFILAFLVCPILFLIGVIGSIIKFRGVK